MPDPIRAALIGAGSIAAEHVRGLLRHPDRIRCVAMADVSPENRRARLSQYGSDCAGFDDYRAMLSAMSGKTDAVIICLPHHLHADAIVAAAESGLHILCEKPLCTTRTDADRIGAALKSTGVTYMSGHNQLFLPAVQKARELIETGTLGRVFWLRSQDCFWANWGEAGDPFRGTWRANRSTQGGGVLIDTGYHPTYRLLHLAGSPVTDVRASMARFRQSIEGEDTAAVQVRFQNGAIGEILTSWAFAQPSGTHQIHVIGEAGELYGSGDTLFLHRAGSDQPERFQMPFVHTFEAQMGHFADCLIHHSRPLHGYEQARAVLEVILRAGESAEGWTAG